MKRFAWLWGAVGGAIVLPPLKIVFALLYLNSLWDIPSGLVFPTFHWNVSDLEAIVPPACAGAVLGALSAALCRGRSFTTRAICAGVGVMATAIGFGLLWRRLLTPAPEPNILGLFHLDLKQEFLLLCVKIAPAVLWAWVLVFAAPFMRSSPENARLELALKMAAGGVAGAVLLPLFTGIGANVFLLRTGETRAWIGTLVGLFWVQLPLTGAVFGVLSIALWASRRTFWLRATSVLALLGASWLTWQWANQHVFYWFRPIPILVALIAAPTTLWALGLLFFVLVARERRDLI